MSTRASTIPRTAILRRHSAATSPDGRRVAHFEVHSAEISLGYRSNYSRIPARWYVLRADGRTYAWRYSGARIDDADRDQLAAIAEARAAGWIVL